MPVKPIPEGYHTITPFLTVQGADKLIDFTKQVFAATEIERMTNPDGTVKHAEMRIGDSVVMLSEARGEWKPMPAALYVYVSDVNAVYQRALQAGAVSLMEPANTFYGNRESGVKDQFGNYWWITTHFEDVALEEIQKRAAAQTKPLENRQASMSREERLRLLNEQYVRASLAGDVEWYRAHLADEFVCIESDGSVLDKDAFLQMTASSSELAEYRLDEVEIKFYGAVALVRCTGSWTAKNGALGMSRYVDVYAQSGDDWKAVSAQITRPSQRP